MTSRSPKVCSLLSEDLQRLSPNYLFYNGSRHYELILRILEGECSPCGKGNKVHTDYGLRCVDYGLDVDPDELTMPEVICVFGFYDGEFNIPAGIALWNDIFWNVTCITRVNRELMHHSADCHSQAEFTMNLCGQCTKAELKKGIARRNLMAL